MKTQQEILENTIQRCKERKILIPTYKQMRNPNLIPRKIIEQLKHVGLWDLNPLNLFRITWKNEPVPQGGGFGHVNYIEFPSIITGVKARIVMLLGKFFPTGAHKVGATFGPLVERLINGRFDPTTQKALWPSTGNYCRGGAYNSYLLGCPSIAVLPEQMSKERFEWLRKLGSEIFATHGCESNVKEIYDKTKELERERGNNIVTLNQFCEMGNPMWHYAITGPAMQEVFEAIRTPHSRFSGVFLHQGSAGTLGCCDYLREIYPSVKVCAGEAIQCPTLLYNGYGAHRIEGIGDKHVPWVHNIRNMDLVAGVDDETTIRLMRLFNEPAGHQYLIERGIPTDLVSRLHLLGISGISNLIGCIKLAKYYEMNPDDTIFTVATDSMEMYQSRLAEEREHHGDYKERQAVRDFDGQLLNTGIEHVLELSYYEKKRIHNLKYFTWVEQQGKTVEELDSQWHDRNYWHRQFSRVEEWDRKIEEFNARTGLLSEFC